MVNIGVNWKFGCIYVKGYGAPEDDYKAYNFLPMLLKKVLILVQRMRVIFLIHWLNLRAI